MSDEKTCVGCQLKQAVKKIGDMSFSKEIEHWAILDDGTSRLWTDEDFEFETNAEANEYLDGRKMVGTDGLIVEVIGVETKQRLVSEWVDITDEEVA